VCVVVCLVLLAAVVVTLVVLLVTRKHELCQCHSPHGPSAACVSLYLRQCNIRGIVTQTVLYHQSEWSVNYVMYNTLRDKSTLRRKRYTDAISRFPVSPHSAAETLFR